MLFVPNNDFFAYLAVFILKTGINKLNIILNQCFGWDKNGMLLSMPEQSPKRYFENLDGLRFILAMTVFLQHSMFGITLNTVVHSDVAQRLIAVTCNGYYGVSFFFVISGFLITYLMLREQNATSQLNVRHFYIRRILRIWPVYYGTLMFSFLLYPLVKTRLGYTDENPYNIVYHLLFLSNFDSIHVLKMNLTGIAPMMIGINWSVAIEEQFYVFWPLIFLILPGRKFIIGIAMVAIASWIFHAFGSDPAVQYYHTLYVMSDLAIGACFAYLAFYKPEQLSSFLESLPRIAIVTIYAAGIAFLMYADTMFNDKFLASGARVINTLFFGFVIVEQSYASHSFFKFSYAKRLSSLGKYTFAFYMLHPIGIQAAILAFRYAGWKQDTNFGFGMLYVAIAFIVGFTLAVACYALVESKFLDLRKKFH